MKKWSVYASVPNGDQTANLPTYLVNLIRWLTNTPFTFVEGNEQEVARSPLALTSIDTVYSFEGIAQWSLITWKNCPQLKNKKKKTMSYLQPKINISGTNYHRELVLATKLPLFSDAGPLGKDPRDRSKTFVT